MTRIFKRFVRKWNTDFRIRRKQYLDWDMWDVHGSPMLPEPVTYYALQYRILPFVWITIQAFYDDEPWVAQAQAEEALHYLTIND